MSMGQMDVMYAPALMVYRKRNAQERRTKKVVVVAIVIVVKMAVVLCPIEVWGAGQVEVEKGGETKIGQ